MKLGRNDAGICKSKEIGSTEDEFQYGPNSKEWLMNLTEVVCKLTLS